METQAAQVRAALKGFCRRLEPTGALRRGDPTSSTIEFICLAEEKEALVTRCLRNTLLSEHKEQLLSVSFQNGLFLNLWFAQSHGGDLFKPKPGNFEVLQVIHTPTRQYFRDFLQHIRKAGYFFDGNHGLRTADGQQVAVTEAEIYAELGLELPAPSDQLDSRPKRILPRQISTIVGSAQPVADGMTLPLSDPCARASK